MATDTQPNLTFAPRYFFDEIWKDHRANAGAITQLVGWSTYIETQAGRLRPGHVIEWNPIGGGHVMMLVEEIQAIHFPGSSIILKGAGRVARQGGTHGSIGFAHLTIVIPVEDVVAVLTEEDPADDDDDDMPASAVELAEIVASIIAGVHDPATGADRIADLISQAHADENLGWPTIYKLTAGLMVDAVQLGPGKPAELVALTRKTLDR